MLLIERFDRLPGGRRQSYAEASLPKVLDLIGGMIAAGKAFVKAFRPIGDVIVGALVAFFDLFKNPKIQAYFESIGRSLGKAFDSIGQSIQQNKPYLKAIAKFILNDVIPAMAQWSSVTIPALARAIGAAITWSKNFSLALLQMTKGVLKGFQWLLRGVTKVFGGILDAAVAALGWVPLYGGPLKHAQAMFEALGKNANQQLSSMISHVQGVQNAIAGLPKDTTIRLNMVTVHTTINKTQHQLSGRSGDPGQFGSPLVPHASSAGGGFTPSPSHASFGSGPAVFHIYDADRKLLGSMRGVAKEEIHGQATFDKRMFRMLGAQSPRTKRR